MKPTIAIVDDHELMAKALSGLVQKFGNYEVLYDVSSGEELTRRLHLQLVPDIVLLDINMPGMNGYEVALWLKNNFPNIKIIALSMNDREESIVKMLRSGACGYLLKGCKPHELKQALDTVVQKGFYYTEFVTSQLIKNLNNVTLQNPIERLGINEKEKLFIQLSCSDLTYVEIADKMCLSPRTIDGYRESIFQKMEVKSRVGMIIKAIQFKIVDI
ncbi:response regulator [Dyadobacter subterraneus]|uniref:Response regulator transcription factor n=1 Tax=Dyadobacter subterraneus TaxID=2773304 RepID=A0ABR9WE31_9BACT|nr:response regulator transcription factor [Dyadobacter subterraneus]MBE9463745.1 response regulator transcription factor [Dyadobacter subterraneus]